ncbi:MAG: UDP-3-O-(3-hydroxymyristoyl)glucosamine N-acyltransferase [Bacteroidota bacterium]
MEFTARQLADLLQGDIEGDAQVTVNSLSKIEEGQPRSVSFLANELYTEYIYNTDASVVIVAKNFAPEQAIKPTCTLIRVDDPRMAFARLLEAYSQLKSQRTGVEQPSFVHEDANVGEDVYIGAFAYIGAGAVIGKGTQIHPHAFVGEGAKVGENSVIHSGARVSYECEIGAHCTLQPNVIIGGDGFGFAPNQDNNYHKVPHNGNVVLEDHVEVGANTCIDRATLGSTIIRKGVKLDNLIQIAHNVEIGENTVIAAQVGIAGSTKIGRNCMIGGQVGIVGHLSIADGVKIGAQAGIGNNVEKEGEVLLGSPAMPRGEYYRSYALFRKLPELKEKIDNFGSGKREIT